MKTSVKHVFVGGLVLTSLLAGCVGPSVFNRRTHKGGGEQNRERVLPVVAVMDFENRAGFSGQWNLGAGFAEMLITELMQTRRAVVVERKYLKDVMGEIRLQEHPYFREEGRVETGRLKNARYLIRAAITDFTVTGDASGWFASKSGALRGGGSRARVSLHLRISDVETGEILRSIKSSGTATAGFFSARAQYDKVAFGGEAFYRTPLGQASEKAIQKALRPILDSLPPETWQPRIAAVEGARVIVNGGENVNLKVGDLFELQGPGRKVTDPETGNVIDELPGSIIGRIRITEVKALAAYGVLESGQAERGQALRRKD